MSGVFERFTQPVRQVIVFAQQEARVLKHNYLGTEHILLGLLREKEGLGAQVLESVNVTVDGTRAQVVEMVGQGAEVAPSVLPFTPRTKKVFELGMRDADPLEDGQVATHHLLLGLLSEGGGVANRVLDSAAEPEHLRGLVLAGLDSAPIEPPAPRSTVTRISRGTGPGQFGGADPAPSAVEVCSFCGQSGTHVFAGFPPKADEVSVCELCLDVFHADLVQQRGKAGPEGPAADVP